MRRRADGQNRRRLKSPGDELVDPQGSVEGEPGPRERRVVAKRGQERRPFVRLFRQRAEDAYEQDHQRQSLTRDQPEEVSRYAESGDGDEQGRQKEALRRSGRHRAEHEGGGAEAVAHRQRRPLGADGSREHGPPYGGA